MTSFSFEDALVEISEANFEIAEVEHTTHYYIHTCVSPFEMFPQSFGYSS